MNNNKNVADMDSFEILEKVFDGKIPEVSGSPVVRSPGDIRRGVVESTLARRLFAAHYLLNAGLERIQMAQFRPHVVSLVYNQCRLDTNRVSMSTENIIMRRDLILHLFWQAVTEEHPAVATSFPTLKDGWTLFASNSVWNNILVSSDVDDVVNNLMGHIAAIVKGRCGYAGVDELMPELKEEEVLVTLKDDRVKSFAALYLQLRTRMEKALKEYKDAGDKNNSDVDRENEVVKIRLKTHYFMKLSETLSMLLWLGVRDSYPVLSDIENLGIRRGWVVVRPSQSEIDKIRNTEPPILLGKMFQDC